MAQGPLEKPPKPDPPTGLAIVVLNTAELTLEQGQQLQAIVAANTFGGYMEARPAAIEALNNYAYSFSTIVAPFTFLHGVQKLITDVILNIAARADFAPLSVKEKMDALTAAQEALKLELESTGAAQP